MMNPEVKSKWLAALRSGEYKQAKGLLRDHQGYCCLGVLQDIFQKEHNLEWSKAAPHDTCFTPAHGTNWGVPTGECQHWAGLTYNNPIVQVPATLQDVQAGFSVAHGMVDQSLSACNDHYKMDFNQIADIIEKQL